MKTNCKKGQVAQEWLISAIILTIFIIALLQLEIPAVNKSLDAINAKHKQAIQTYQCIAIDYAAMFSVPITMNIKENNLTCLAKYDLPGKIDVEPLFKNPIEYK